MIYFLKSSVFYKWYNLPDWSLERNKKDGLYMDVLEGGASLQNLVPMDYDKYTTE